MTSKSQCSYGAQFEQFLRTRSSGMRGCNGVIARGLCVLGQEAHLTIVAIGEEEEAGWCET